MVNDIEKEIAKHREALNKLQAQKRNAKRPKVKKPLRPKGRPKIDQSKIDLAFELAKDFPITDVSRRLDISMSSLYRAGIKRYKINAIVANDKISLKS